MLFASAADAQTKKTSTKKKKTITLPKLPTGSSSGTSTNSTTAGSSTTTRPSDNLMADGLKSALEVGFGLAADRVSSVDGFFANAMIKILMPPEAVQMESTLRGMGLGSICDDVILSLNRAAEGAAKEAKPIFINAIKQMTITDAVNILLGPDNAATEYFRRTLGTELQVRFQPIIKTQLDNVNATKYWGKAMNTYNSIPLGVQKINPNLPEYVTQKAIDGIFVVLAEEEKKIRKDPISRTTSIIQDIFGWVDKTKK